MSRYTPDEICMQGLSIEIKPEGFHDMPLWLWVRDDRNGKNLSASLCFKRRSALLMVREMVVTLGITPGELFTEPTPASKPVAQPGKRSAFA